MNRAAIQTICEHLKLNDIKISHVSKLYSSSDRNYIAEGNNNKYFVKIISKSKKRDILEGEKSISISYDTPKNILTIDTEDNMTILIQEYKSGLLFSQIVSEESNYNRLYELERRRLNMFKDCILNTAKIKEIDIRSLKCANIFWNRFQNERFDNFYLKSIKISEIKDKAIYINNIRQSKTLSEIIESCRNRSLTLAYDTYLCVNGHGDAHRGNIIVDNINELYFIDTEYSQIEIPIEIEIAKSYYNDLYGFLFFSNKDILGENYHTGQMYFDIDGIYISNYLDSDNNFKDFLKNKADKLLTTAEKSCELNNIKFKKRLFKDLLLMCHFLTKDPNTYTNEAFNLFIVIMLEIENMPD